MVVFSCDACGESLRKKDVQKHYQFNCRRCETLTCVDCKKQFWGDEFAAHTQCITDEGFKYGLVNDHKSDKGQEKQELWISNIDELLADRSTDRKYTSIFIEMKKYENVPRKKKPFMNWSKCTLRRFPHKIVEEAFDLLLATHAKKQQVRTEAQNAENANRFSEVTAESKGASNGSTVDSNGNVKKNKKKRKSPDEEPQHSDDECTTPPKKKKSRNEAPSKEPPLSEMKNGKKSRKFKLEKVVARVLLEKNNKMKLKKLVKKVVTLYILHCEETGCSRRWDTDDISKQVDELVSTNEHFDSSHNCVQLSESGIAKFSSSGVDAPA